MFTKGGGVAATLNYKVTSADVIDALVDLKRLPSFSNTLAEFDRLVNQPAGTHVEEVAKLLQSDPRMMAGVISTANTARYARGGQKVTRLIDAVKLLGVKDVRAMIMALSFLDVFQDGVDIDADAFLKHSLVSGFVAKNLASAFNVNEYDAFLMGLFHEIGVYILATYSEEGFALVVEKSHRRLKYYISAEREIFGVTHSSVGARIISHWHMPEVVVRGVLGHHSPARIELKFQDAAYLTYLAESGAVYLGVFNGVAGGVEGVLGDSVLRVLQKQGLDEEAYLIAVEKGYEEAQSVGLI